MSDPLCDGTIVWCSHGHHVPKGHAYAPNCPACLQEEVERLQKMVKALDELAALDEALRGEEGR